MSEYLLLEEFIRQLTDMFERLNNDMEENNG